MAPGHQPQLTARLDWPLLSLFVFVLTSLSSSGYTRAVITPNAMEFSRLVKAVLQRDVAPCVSPDPRIVEDLVNSMGNITVLHKGAPDLISDGRVTEECVAGGSPRRCGGQGDVLAGSLATFLHWSTMAADCAGETPGPQIVAAWGAARLTRACAEQVRQQCSLARL